MAHVVPFHERVLLLKVLLGAVRELGVVDPLAFPSARQDLLVAFDVLHDLGGDYLLVPDLALPEEVLQLGDGLVVHLLEPRVDAAQLLQPSLVLLEVLRVDPVVIACEHPEVDLGAQLLLQGVHEALGGVAVRGGHRAQRRGLHLAEHLFPRIFAGYLLQPLRDGGQDVAASEDGGEVYPDLLHVEDVDVPPKPE